MQATQTLITKREREIVSHLAEGLNSNEVAERLFISLETVKCHRKNIIEKTGARNTAHLIWLAMLNGWISTTSNNAMKQAGY